MIYGFYWKIPPVPLKGQRIRPRPTQRQVVGDFGSTAETAAAAATALKAEVDSKAFAFTSKLASIEAALGAETWRTVADIAFWGFYVQLFGGFSLTPMTMLEWLRYVRVGSGMVQGLSANLRRFFGPTQVADSTNNMFFSRGHCYGELTDERVLTIGVRSPALKESFVCSIPTPFWVTQNMACG